MKPRVLNKIENTPITYPYYDIEAWKAIEPMDARYKAASFEVTEKMAKEYGFDEDRVPEILLAQYQAAKYVTSRFKDLGYTYARVSELCGIDKTMLSKYGKGLRPFAPGASSITPLCYNVLSESCNKVLLGDKGKIQLPKIYEETARALYELSEADRADLLRRAKIQMAIYDKKYPQEYPNAPHRDLSDLIGERILELAYDRGVQMSELLGPETPYGFRNYLRQFTLDKIKRDSPRMGYLMFLTMETGIAIDYFIAEDFSVYVPCYYNDAEGVNKEVSDKTILSFIGLCASLPINIRNDLIGEAVGLALAKNFF